MEDREDASAVRSSIERELQKVVLSKMADTGGGFGPATPPQWNGRWAVSKLSHEHIVYVKTKVDITPVADTPT